MATTTTIYEKALSLAEAVRYVPTPTLEAMDASFDETMSSRGVGLAIVRTTRTKNGQRIFIVVMGGTRVSLVTHIALPRDCIQAPEYLTHAKTMNGDRTFFAILYEEGGSPVSFRSSSLHYQNEDATEAENQAVARAREEKITTFLDDTSPDAEGFLSIGNVDLRFLVSMSSRAVEIRASTKAKTSTKRRRVDTTTPDK